MARRTVIELTDDIDGTPADETVTFSLNGINYEIDLSKVNASKLRMGLEPYVNAGRRLRKDGTQTKAGNGVSYNFVAKQSAAAKELNKTIREWASAHGYDIPGRGRIPNLIVEAYEAQKPAHGWVDPNAAQLAATDSGKSPRKRAKAAAK